MPSADESPSPADRVRDMDGVHNLRDLGGLPTEDGRVVRAGRVWRSDYPAFVDTSHAVRHLGLRTVVDLRRGSEAAHECVSWYEHGVEHHRCPVSAGKTDSWHARYAAYLDHRPETVVEAVRHVIDPAAHPVLFHCAAGKDRTGVVAALVLKLLGVPDEQVVADYALTDVGLPHVLERLRRSGPYVEMLAGSSDDDQRARASHMRDFLSHLADRGGAEEWMVAHGLDRSRIDAFRTAMIGPTLVNSV